MMKGGYKNLGGNSMKIVQENYTSTGSVEPVKKNEEWHHLKERLVKTKSKPGVHPTAHHHKDKNKEEGE
jgi:hypothetical protein